VGDTTEEERHTRGRTKRAPADKLRAPLSVLLTETQRDALYKEAREAGYLSVSEYIRRRKLGLDASAVVSTETADAAETAEVAGTAGADPE